jgi:signal recognition particle receptor subunit beta
MARIDATNRRIEVKVVWWGPARGGKTTSLRSVHASCDPADRGVLSSIDTEDERTYFFDYAPLDLPRFGDYQPRVHAYTVPGQDAYVETRRRILRGADGVVFVADSSPNAQTANLVSWRGLLEALAVEDRPGRPTPIVLAANKQDLATALEVDEVRRRLVSATPPRGLIDAVGTSAIVGRGVLGCFRRVVVAAVARALGPEGDTGGVEARRRFLSSLTAKMRGVEDGLPAGSGGAPRTITVPISSRDPDAGGLEAAVETARAFAETDARVKALSRERDTGRLLVDVGHLCLRTQDGEDLVRSVVASLVVGLEAAVGWVGLSDGCGGYTVFDQNGRATDAPAVADVAQGIGPSVRTGDVVPVGGGVGPRLPAAAGAGRALFAPFDVPDRGRAFLLLVAPPLGAFPADAGNVLAAAGSFLGLALARHAIATRADA